jgi:hypothetical protein
MPRNQYSHHDAPDSFHRPLGYQPKDVVRSFGAFKVGQENGIYWLGSDHAENLAFCPAAVSAVAAIDAFLANIDR